MPVLNRGQIPDIIDTRPLWISFFMWKQNPKSYTEIFYVSNEEDAHVDILEFSGLGRFQLKEEGTPVVYDIPVQGLRRRVVHSTFALGTAATHESVKDAKYNVIDKQSAALTRSQLDHEERLAWDLLRGAFTTSLSIDGVAIVSSAHGMLKPTTPGQTRSNRMTPFIPLSYEGLEAMTLIFLNQISNEGHFIGNDLNGSSIVCHTNKTHIANNIIDAKGRPGTTNTFDTNQIARMNLKVVASPYLGSTAAEFEAYFLAGPKGSSMETGNGLTFNSRETARITNSTDPDTGDRKWREWYRASTHSRGWEEMAGTLP